MSLDTSLPAAQEQNLEINVREAERKLNQLISSEQQELAITYYESLNPEVKLKVVLGRNRQSTLNLVYNRLRHI